MIPSPGPDPRPGPQTGSRTAYYDGIAKRWHEATGYRGGAFKEEVLNDLLLGKLSDVDRRAILELGAGNGYFLPLLLRRFSGQVPSSLTVTDRSQGLLQIARRHFGIPGAEYRCLDVCEPLPFADGRFDLILASMLFNEVPAWGLRGALAECHRVLSGDGLFLVAVTHPDFIAGLRRRGMLKRTRDGVLTMPGAGSLRLPVVIRSRVSYRSALREAGFDFEEEEAFATPEVLDRKPGLREAGKVPLALVYSCARTGSPQTRGSRPSSG